MVADYTISLEITGKDDVSPAFNSAHKAMVNLGSSAPGALGSVVSGLQRIAEFAVGGLIVGGIQKIGGALMELGGQALDSYAKHERLGMALESLVAKEIAAASGTMKMVAAGQIHTQLTEKQRAEIDKLNESLPKMNAQLAVNKERLAEAITKGKESSAEIELRRQNIAALEGKIADANSRVATLSATEGKLITVMKQVTTGQISVGEAMKQAGPQAKELLDWIQKLAIESPFTQEGVAAALRMAMAYGFTSKEAKRLTQATIDFASGSGASESAMATIALALGQIKAKGKLAGQEVLQLVNAGLSVDAILAKAFGKSTAEIVDMREKGLIPADKAIEAITKSLEQDFGGAAKRQSQTFSGLISSLSDIKEVGLREFFTGTFQAIQPYIAQFTDKLSSPEFMDKLREIGNIVGTNIAGAIKTVAGLVAAFQKGGAGGLATALGIPPEVQNTITNIIGTIERLFAATSKGGAGGLLEALNLPPGIVGAINNVLWSVILLGDWIQTNLPIAQAAFQTAWKVIGDVVMTVVDIFKADVLPAFQEAFQSITGAMAEMGINWGDVWGAIGTALKVVAVIIGALLLFLVSLIVGFAKGWAAAVKSITKTIKEMTVNFKGMVEGIAKLFAGFMEVVKGIFSGDLPRVFRGVKLEIEGLVQFAGSMFKQMATVIGGFLDAIVGFVSQFVTGVIKFFQNLYDRLVGGSIVPEMMAAIQKVITDILNAVRDFIQSILNAIAGIFRSVFASLVEIVSSALAAVQNAVTAGLNAIRSLFETGFANLVSIVSAAWTAILNGIATAWQAITDAINWAIQAIPMAVAQAIQGLVAIGASIVTTIAQGITDAWNAAAGVVQNLYGLLMGLIGDVWKGDLPGTLVAFGSTILSAISDGFTAAWNAVGGFVEVIWGLIAGLPDALAGAWSAVVGMGGAFVDALIQGVADNWQTFIDTIWQWIQDWLVPGSIPKVLQKQVAGLRATGGMMADLMAQGFSARVGGLGLGMQFGSSMASTANTNYYHNSNLYVTTVSPVENIVADFGMLDVLAGVV